MVTGVTIGRPEMNPEDADIPPPEASPATGVPKASTA